MKIDRLFIDHECTITQEIEYIISKLKIEPEWVADKIVVYDALNRSDDPVSAAKKNLLITRNKGAVIKPCPGTSHYTCCDYAILHTGTFCTLDCSYCILQAYFHPPVLQYFAGFKTLASALDQQFKQPKISRLGTGEFTDSLIWENFTRQPQFLIEKFGKQNHAVLELKTKTVNIQSLLNLDHNGKTIIAWSLNTPAVIQSEERGTASLAARLKAAQKVEAKGYKLAFHFDPMVIYPGCEEAYKAVIHQIFKHVHPKNIVWISIGTFRFMPALKQMIENRFKDSNICCGEFILGLDNKMRYFKPLRIKLYKKIIDTIKAYAPELLVYFCMEDEQVWESTMDFFPDKNGELGYLLDNSAATHCDLDLSYL